MPYEYRIITSYIFDNAKECSTYEKDLHKKYKSKQYFPLYDFNGSYECFESEIINDFN